MVCCATVGRSVVLCVMCSHYVINERLLDENNTSRHGTKISPTQKMYQVFLEIGYEAEVTNTKENPELLEIAKEQCNENPETRGEAIAQLRQMIYDRGECDPIRTDDEFLLRFLRAKNFIVPKAHRVLVRYCQFREQYPYLYKDVDLFSLVKANEAYEGTMMDRPDYGRISICRFGRWDPSEFPVEELVKAGMAIFEIGIRQPKLQIIGGTLIVDMEGITLRHVATLTPTVAYQIVSLLGGATPTRLKSCHIINYSWILNTFFYIFKKFMSEEAYNRIFFHRDLKSLHQHIDPECLPQRLGGTCRSSGSVGLWLTKIKKYRTKEFDEEMKKLGYIIKE